MKLTVKNPTGVIDQRSITNMPLAGGSDVKISYHRSDAETKGLTHNLRIRESYSFVTDWPVCDQAARRNKKPVDDFIVEW